MFLNLVFSWWRVSRPHQLGALCPALLPIWFSDKGGVLITVCLGIYFICSGTIDEETKSAFVAEVERVGRDPVYWVRREASFAVGALAKVVPQEVVLTTLVNLFHSSYPCYS